MTERKKFKIPSAEEMDISSTPKIDTFAVYKRQQKEDEMGTKELEIRKIDSNSEKAEPSAPHHITVNQGTTSSEKTAQGSSKIQSSEVKPGTSKRDGLGPEIPENLQVKGGKTNSIIVNPRQRGNPIIKFIRNVPWEYGDIVPDYLMGQTTCALFLSLRYHQLHPDYIHNRLKQLGRSYELRVMLVQVDVKESHHLLKELAKICVLADCTLILAFSTEEAGRYLETYKVYENKPPDAIMEKTDQDFMSKITECLTNVKSVNKTDTMTLMSTFDTLENVMKASTEDLSLCPGFGPQKAKRLHDVFQEPFLKANKKVKSAERFKWVGYRKYYKDRPYIRKRIVANPDELKTYTFEPLKTLRTGGRDSTGRVWTNRIGGGDKHDWLMVDHKRPAEKDGPSVVERVMEIVVDPHRTSRLAVVAHGETKRRITATENMKVGDIIKTTNHIPTIAVVAVEGNSHPLGALPPGTIVNSVEEYAGHGGIFARAAGAGAQVVKQVGGKSYIKLPSGHEIVLPQSCMATVGRTWKPEEFIKMRKAGEIRWKGIRPRGGLFQKKTGYHGRKIRKPKSFVRDENPPPPRFTKKKFIME